MHDSIRECDRDDLDTTYRLIQSEISIPPLALNKSYGEWLSLRQSAELVSGPGSLPFQKYGKQVAKLLDSSPLFLLL